MDDLTPLVTRAQGNDDQAYGELVRRFQDMAYGYAYAILHDFHLAEDAAQEAFIEGYRCLPGLEHPPAFPAWLKRIVFKHCDRLTRGKRVPTTALEAAGEVAGRTPGPDEIAEKRDVQAQVLAAVQALPEEQRMVTTLYYLQQYSQDEIAAFLDLPPSTVKSRLHESRQHLKKRMMDMVRDALKSNALPESFTEETLTRAVTQAAELNQQRQYGEAENLLRDVLGKAPGHVGALKELNRTVMHGRVYGEQRWNRLPELIEHGRAILASGTDDEYVYHQLTLTLLALPAIPEAIELIESWIARKGSQPEWVGMLAWARGCVAEYAQAEAHWKELLAMVRDTDSQKTMANVLPSSANALVDCFAAAQELERARRVVQAAWEHGRHLDAVTHKYRTRWLSMFHQAGLPIDELARELVARLGPAPEQSLEDQGMALAIRAWTGDTQRWMPDWLAWIRACAEGDSWHVIEHFRRPVAGVLRTTGQLDLFSQWAQATWEWLATGPEKETAPIRRCYSWERFNVWAYLKAGDLSAAEALAYRGIEEQGYAESGYHLIEIAARRGGPTPPELAQIVSEKGIEAIDSYGKWGQYFLAREAAAAGDSEKAFEALHRALNHWTNPPLIDVEAWENDAYWGDLREHPEYQRIYAEKRQRIGPVYGTLWYFPGW